MSSSRAKADPRYDCTDLTCTGLVTSTGVLPNAVADYEPAVGVCFVVKASVSKRLLPLKQWSFYECTGLPVIACTGYPPDKRPRLLFGAPVLACRAVRRSIDQTANTVNLSQICLRKPDNLNVRMSLYRCVELAPCSTQFKLGRQSQHGCPRQ